MMSQIQTPDTDRARISPLHHCVLGAAALSALAVTLVVGLGARQWIGQPFPGFFVLDNRVIPSVGLTGWPGSRDGTLYQRTVVAIDGIAIADGADAYRRVARVPAGTSFTYTLRNGGATETLTLGSKRFARGDYWAIFGAYVATGILYLLLGLLGAWLFPEERLGRALLFAGATGGIYALSAVGLYAPGGDLRIHALAEAFLPATLVYLALVFPRERGRLTTPAVAVAWWLSLALAIPYQLLLEQPGAYSTLHAACEAYLGAAGFALIVRLIVEHARAAERADLLVRTATAGALLGLGVPAVVMLVSGLTGGNLPVNVCTVTGFLFPLCFGYGLVRERIERHRGLLAAAATSSP
jgi:hypothetical protein